MPTAHILCRLGIPFLLAICAAPCWGQSTSPSRHSRVDISYTGEGGFTITRADVALRPMDIVSFHTRDEGTLVLRLDDGTIYASDDGSIDLSAAVFARSSIIRCSIVLPDGSVTGWESGHDDRYGVAGSVLMPETERRPGDVLPPPDGVTATGADRRVDIKWNAVKGASAYSVKRRIRSQNFFEKVARVSAPATTFQTLFA